MQKTVLFLTLFFITLGCKTAKFQATELPPEHIIVGNGGGFTGVQTEFIVLENGQVFEKSSLTGTTNEIKSINKKKAQHFFELVNSIQIDSMDFNHPGNIYKYVTLNSENRKESIVWGDVNYEVSGKVEECYQSIWEAIKSKNPER